MRPQREYWWRGTLVTVLVALALATATVAYVIGAIVLAAVTISQQYRFLQTIRAINEQTTITQTLSQPRVTADEAITLTISVQLSAPAPARLDITPGLPVGLTGTTPTLTVAPGEETATTEVTLTPSVAGVFDFEQATVTITESLFSETLRLGTAPELIAEPRSSRQVHVGAGGDEIAAAYGDHSAERGGSGLDPAELRKYAPGDPATRIDWKATARLGDTYVREFEAQTDRTTVLVSDLRAPLDVGESGGRKIDYVRDVLLSMTTVAERSDDPLGLLMIDESGISHRIDPNRSNTQYQAIQTRLQEMEATTTPGVPGSGGPNPSRAAQSAGLLRSDDTQFGQTLRPYVSSVRSHVERVRTEPLFDAINRTSDGEEQRLFVIATDDSCRAELREAVKLATRRGNQVLVLLTPSPLFEASTLANLEETYESYLDFEQYRRELDRAPRTRAFEVGPGDRLDAVLAAGQRRRRVTRE